jgi:tRNA nucleotidyltransferase (CCA-adding enzyme)
MFSAIITFAKVMQRKVFIFSLLILLVFPECKKKQPKVARKPDWVIEEKKMVDIILDLRIADAATYNNNSGPPRNKKTDWYFVMKKHKVEDSTFRKSHEYYCKYPEVLASIYEQTIDKLSEMQALNAEKSGLVDTLRH